MYCHLLCSTETRCTLLLYHALPWDQLAVIPEELPAVLDLQRSDGVENVGGAEVDFQHCALSTHS